MRCLRSHFQSCTAALRLPPSSRRSSNSRRADPSGVPEAGAPKRFSICVMMYEYVLLFFSSSQVPNPSEPRVPGKVKRGQGRSRGAERIGQSWLLPAERQLVHKPSSLHPRLVCRCSSSRAACLSGASPASHAEACAQEVCPQPSQLLLLRRPSRRSGISASRLTSILARRR